MKFKALAVTLFAGSLALCSCSGGSGDVDKTLPQEDPPAKTDIVFWHCLGHDKTENLKKIVAQFNSDYSGKYEVKLSHLAGDYDSLHDALKTKLASGEIPALTMGYPDSFSEYMTNDLGTSQILRLDNFIKDPTYGYADEELNDFVPGYYAEGTGYQFSGVWSMPMYKSTEIMYYNQSYFDGCNDQNKSKFKSDDTFKALCDEVEGKSELTSTLKQDLAALRNYCSSNGGYVYSVPSTWDELINLGKKMLSDRKKEKLSEKDVFYPIGYDSDANLLISQFAQRDIPYTVNNEETQADPTKHFVFNNDKAKAFVTELTNNIKANVITTKNALGGTYTNTLFTELKSAMVIGSTGGSAYNVSSNFVVSLAPVPTYTKDTKLYIQQGPSICFFNNGNDFIHKGAWLFYKYIADPSNNLKLGLENSYDPVRKSAYESVEYSNWIAKKDKGLKYAIPSVTKTLQDNYYTSPTFIGSSTARNEIGGIITSVIRNKMSVETAFEQALNKCKQAA